MRIWVIFLLFPISLYSQEYYPKERSFTVEPYFKSGPIGELGSMDMGGTLNSGVIVNGLFRNYSFLTLIGVKYQVDNVNTTFFRSGLGYGISIDTKYTNITPGVLALYNSSYNRYGAEVSGFVDFTFHIYNRDLLMVSPSISISTFGEIGFHYGLELGIKRSGAFFIPVPPVEPLVTIKEAYFSPDGDGENDELVIGLSGSYPKSIKKWKVLIFNSRGYMVRSWEGGTELPEKLIWDGVENSSEIVESASDYFVRLYTWDYLKRIASDTRDFRTDILVIRDGDRYRIKIPSIIFPPNSGTFEGLDKEVVSSNLEIINSIAKKLKRYPEYKIVVEGHGNIVNWRDENSSYRENRDILIPLTNNRAQFVSNKLIEFGIPGDKLEYKGVGGSDPVVPFVDRLNIWKNRRVELILVK